MAGAIGVGHRRALTLSVLLCILFFASFPLEASRGQTPPTEERRVRELPGPTPHWAFVYSGFSSFPSDYPSNVTIVDGDTRQLLGSIDGGFVSSIAISPDQRELYSADTFYSRGSRGVRTDVVTVYNLKTLQPVAEVIIPPKRQLSAQDNITSGVTPDGRFLLVVNMTPATSVTVVDVKQRKFVGEIELPGCTEVIVTGVRRFASLCGDGSLMTTDFDDRARITARKRSRPFFDIARDPVFAEPVIVYRHAWFVSYRGTVYPVDLSRDETAFAAAWPLLSHDEAAANWKPGGLQSISADPTNSVIYVLMHQGGEWTHKAQGKEVWVYDLMTHKRIRRIALKAPARAIMTTADDAPLLFAVSEPADALSLAGSIGVYSAVDGKMLGRLNGFPFFFEHIYGP